MRTGDIILIFVIFAVSLGMNAGNLFSVENLITAGVLLAIIAVIAVIILVDYGPLWRLRAEEIRFCEEKDQDRFADAIETFRRKNKLVTKNHLGYLAEAFLRLYQGDFPAAMEALLYCRKQDMEKDNLASVYLMRCKILMFMDQLTADNPDFQYIVRHRSGFNLFERFDYQLISGYMHLRNGDTEKTHQILDQLNSLDPSVSPRAFLWPHEIRWLNSMAVLHDYSQFNFNTQYNLHRGSGSPKYIMASISRQERKLTEQSGIIKAPH